MQEKNFKLIEEFRQTLHKYPEASEKEFKTRELIKEFLEKHTSLEIVDKGRWLYALHKEEGAKETIAFRADHDAIISEDGEAFHGCGHDGHTATLVGLALELEGVKTGNNIVFIFQHAEETGVGAKECVEIFKEVEIDRVYGYHNIPGLPLNMVATKKGPIQCASTGMSIKLEGKQSHASEPEKGINPVYLIADLVEKVKVLSEFDGYGPVNKGDFNFDSMVLCTIVHVKVGEKAFGVSPSMGEIALTIRAVSDDDLEKLRIYIEDYIKENAEKLGIKYSFEYSDTFPDTTNDPEIVEKFFKLLEENNIEYIEMEDPVRASEDFGYYLKEKPGCYFYIGDGEDYTPIHSIEYNFPDEIMPKAIKVFTLLANTHYK